MSQYETVYDAISTDPPSELDKQIDETLFKYISKEIKLESEDEMQIRNQILAEVKRIFQEWVRYVATDILHLPEEEAQEAGGQLFVSGSHRLGVREPGADIDTVCVAPRFCTREHFFTSLKERFQNHPEVINLDAIPNATVPIMSFDFRGVSIDLLFARISENSVPENIDIFDDKILKNLDTASEKSLNGPRVTYMISRLVPSFDNFLIVLRCIRKWAKNRGLYGNKLGYLGGVNLNILVAFVCQLYPNASPSSLLAKFFKVYNQWKWPNPIMLNRIQRLPANDQVWTQEANPYHLMPIITPAYPAMNSSVNVSQHTLRIIQTEISRSHEMIQSIIKSGGNGWEKLFSPSDFFIKYNHYLCCNILGAGKDEASRSWIGFVESRIRKLPDFLSHLQINPIHFYPVKFTTKKTDLSICYFIGFNVEQYKAREDKNIYIDRFITAFRQDLSRYNGEQKEGNNFTADHFRWKQLPDEVFEQLGGRVTAKAMRQSLYRKPGTTTTTTTTGATGAATPTASVVTTSKDITQTPDKSKMNGGSVISGGMNDGEIITGTTSISTTGVMMEVVQNDTSSSMEVTSTTLIKEVEVEMKSIVDDSNALRSSLGGVTTDSSSSSSSSSSSLPSTMITTPAKRKLQSEMEELNTPVTHNQPKKVLQLKPPLHVRGGNPRPHKLYNVVWMLAESK